MLVEYFQPKILGEAWILHSHCVFWANMLRRKKVEKYYRIKLLNV